MVILFTFASGIDAFAMAIVVLDERDCCCCFLLWRLDDVMFVAAVAVAAFICRLRFLCAFFILCMSFGFIGSCSCL
jgi:hypothetical protein